MSILALFLATFAMAFGFVGLVAIGDRVYRWWWYR